MAEEIPTMAVRAILEITKDTGLITDESIDALKAKRVLAHEQIIDLERKCRENRIAPEFMKAEIRRIQQEIHDITIAIEGDPEILS